jgi:hypothetical protein
MCDSALWPRFCYLHHYSGIGSRMLNMLGEDIDEGSFLSRQEKCVALAG